MKTFSEFQMLSEMGTGTKPYKTVKREGAGTARWYYFNGDDGIEFKVQVSFRLIRHALEDMRYMADVEFVSFSESGIQNYDVTNSGTKQMFRVMTTVVESIKDAILAFYKRTGKKVSVISYSAADKSDKFAKTKDKLYAAYVKNIMKTTVIKHGNLRDAKVPDSFYS